jgi:hypothetical protein
MQEGDKINRRVEASGGEEMEGRWENEAGSTSVSCMGSWQAATGRQSGSVTNPS